MSTFVTPKEQQYSNVTSPVEGSALITNGAGKVEFDFRIPEYRFSGQESNPRFRSGELEFRLTSSATNLKTPLPLSAGQRTYISQGIRETIQETIIATRNAEVVQTTVNQNTSITDTSTIGSRIVGVVQQESGSDGNDGDEAVSSDPLSQTFIIEEIGGCFLTSLDLFFSEKMMCFTCLGRGA